MLPGWCLRGVVLLPDLALANLDGRSFALAPALAMIAAALTPPDRLRVACRDRVILVVDGHGPRLLRELDA